MLTPCGWLQNKIKFSYLSIYTYMHFTEMQRSVFYTLNLGSAMWLGQWNVSKYDANKGLKRLVHWNSPLLLILGTHKSQDMNKPRLACWIVSDIWSSCLHCDCWQQANCRTCVGTANNCHLIANVLVSPDDIMCIRDKPL